MRKHTIEIWLSLLVIHSLFVPKLTDERESREFYKEFLKKEVIEIVSEIELIKKICVHAVVIRMRMSPHMYSFDSDLFNQMWM